MVEDFRVKIGNEIYNYNEFKKFINSKKIIVQSNDGYYFGYNNYFVEYDISDKIEVLEGTTSLSDCTFEGFTKVKEITLPNSLKRIGECAFLRCKSLEKLEIPEGVEILNNSAFEYCSLKEVILPSTLETIYYDTFEQNNPNIKIKVPNQKMADKILSMYDDLTSDNIAITLTTANNSAGFL